MTALSSLLLLLLLLWGYWAVQVDAGFICC
jgi:hypothetical protein